MKDARISIIAALGQNRELGKRNGLIWRIPEDLARLKKLTLGHPVIMGRKTFESIGKPLPGRTNIIVSRTTRDIPGCVVARSIHEAFMRAHEIEHEEIFILGGGQIYTEALPYTDRLYITLVEAGDPDADAFFPEYEKHFPNVISRERSANHAPTYTFIIRER